MRIFGLACCGLVVASTCVAPNHDDSSDSLLASVKPDSHLATLLVLANPFSCGLSGAELHRLAVLHEEGRVPVQMVFVARPADSIAVAEAAIEMAFSMPYSILDVDAFARMRRPLGLGLPSFVLARRGRTLAFASNMEPSESLRLLEVLYRP